tara:strand:- start:622 stop:2067 length:1446 start_codon:yes stop_codon:yes gene_type:complete
MSYIGQQLPADVFSGFVTDSFTGDGSATTFTLSKAPFSEDALIVVINNVIQKPTTNFTVSGTTLTIVGTAVASGDVIYATHLSGVIPSTTASKLDATTACTITTNDNSDTLTLISTDADASGGPVLDFYRNSSSPADSDSIAKMTFRGRNDNSQDVDYGKIDMTIIDASDGSEDSQFNLQTIRGGTIRSQFKANNTETVFNDDSVSIDFRVESSGDTHALFVDSSENRVGIGTSSPSNILHIQNASNHPTLEVRSTITPTGSTFGGTIELALGADGVSGSGHADTQAGDNLGRIMFTGQGTDYSYQGGEIGTIVQTGDGNDTRTAQGTAMVFKTMNVGQTGYTEHFRIAQNGDLTATDTSIDSNSDERLKENIQDYTYDINKFKQFKAKTFDWKNPLEHDGKSNNRGFIAQDILAIDDYWINQVDISMKQAEDNSNNDLSLIPAEANGMRLAYTSKLGKKDAMYISIIQQLISRIEALEDA